MAPDFIFLASQSPRRTQLLEQLGVAHRPLLPDRFENAEALEEERSGEPPDEYVLVAAGSVPVPSDPLTEPVTLKVVVEVNSTVNVSATAVEPRNTLLIVPLFVVVTAWRRPVKSNGFTLIFTPSSAKSSCATQPPITCPSVTGVASCRWVRPTMTMSANSSAFAASTSRSRCTGS